MEMLQFVKEHELTHRAQLFVYMRLKGIVPATTRRRLARAGGPLTVPGLRTPVGKTHRVSYNGNLGRKVMVTCPVCDGAIDVDEEDVDEGDSLSCDECGADLKVVSTDPLEIESADEVEEEEDEEILWKRTKKRKTTGSSFTCSVSPDS